MTLEHLKVALSVMQVVLVPLLAAGLTYLNRIRTSVEASRNELQALISTTRDDLRRELHEITTEVRKTNGRIGRLEEWRQGHDHIDDDRENRVTREIDNVREDIRHLQATVIAAQKDHRV